MKKFSGYYQRSFAIYYYVEIGKWKAVSLKELIAIYKDSRLVPGYYNFYRYLFNQPIIYSDNDEKHSESWVAINCPRPFTLRYVICGFDSTVWPANGNVVTNGLQMLTTLLSMSENVMGWLQYPIFQTQTTISAVFKHKHALEQSPVPDSDSVLQAGFTKPGHAKPVATGCGALPRKLQGASVA